MKKTIIKNLILGSLLAAMPFVTTTIIAQDEVNQEQNQRVPFFHLTEAQFSTLIVGHPGGSTVTGFHVSPNFKEELEKIDLQGLNPIQVKDMVMQYTTIFRPAALFPLVESVVADHLQKDVFFQLCVAAKLLGPDFFAGSDKKALGMTYRTIHTAWSNYGNVDYTKGILESLKYPVSTIISQGQTKLEYGEVNSVQKVFGRLRF